MKTGSEELSRISVIRSNNARRRKMRVRRQKSTCRTTAHVSVTARTGKESGGNAGTEVAYGSVEILLTFSSSDRHPQRTDAVVPSAPEEKGTRHVISGGGSESHVARGSCGSVSVIGKRREMEDAVKVELGFMDRGGSCTETYDYFGVFDGHGGSWVAEACSDRLHRIVAEEGGGGGGGGLDWEMVMVRCFGKMDEEVAETAAGNKAQTMKMVGSTAIVAVVGEEVVVVANCGDSRAVLSRGGVALALSADHKPDRPDELKRIEAAGGRVINWNGHRVLGVLATSRSIGDQHLKPYVIPEPEVTVTRRTSSDEFLIIASDGLWDVVSNEVACQVVRRCLDGRIKRRSPELLYESRAAEAAAVLAEFAMARGSEDNVSVVVVKL